MSGKSIFLRILIHVGDNKYELLVSRLVYAAFVEPFDIENRDLVVRHKDNDRLNNLPENLYLAKKESVSTK